MTERVISGEAVWGAGMQPARKRTTARREPSRPVFNGRRAALTDRRRSVERYDQSAVARIAQRMDEQSDAVMQRLDAITDRLGRMDRDLAVGELDREHTRNAMNELRRDIGELRDAVSIKQASEKTGAAAVGKSVWKTKLGMWVAIAAGFTAMVTAGEKLPKAVRAIDATWDYIGGQDEDQK